MKDCELLTKQGYFNRFWVYARTMSQEKAYEKTEAELAKKFKVYRYSSFESFRTCLYRYINFEFKQL